MSKDQPESARRFDGKNEWAGEHERRKRHWGEVDRKWRKERRTHSVIELSENPAPPPSRRGLP